VSAKEKINEFLDKLADFLGITPQKIPVPVRLKKPGKENENI